MKITLTREETAEAIRQYVEKNTGLEVESVAANNNSFDVIIGNSRKSSNSSSSLAAQIAAVEKSGGPYT